MTFMILMTIFEILIPQAKFYTSPFYTLIETTDLLVREVKAREQSMYSKSRIPPK